MDIIADIQKSVPSLTKSQKVVAAKILEDPFAIAFSSIEQFSKQIQVSTATVIRFANVLGFNGYSELQERLRQYCHTQLSPISRLETSRRSQKSGTSILDHIYEVQLNNLRLTYTQELEHKLLAVVRYLKEAPHIYTLGSRGSSAITYYLGHHLNRAFRNTTILPDDNRIADTLLPIQNGDVLIICSMPRYSKLVYRAAQIAKTQGAVVVSITDSIVSPYDGVSDILLPASCRSSDFHNSLLSAMLIAEMIITLLMSDDVEAASHKLHEMESLFDALDTFL